MKRGLVTGAFILFLLIVLTACSADAIVPSDEVVKEVGKEFQLSHMTVPDEWDVVGLVHVPFPDSMPRDESDGYYRAEIYFGKIAESRSEKDFNPSYGKVEYFAEYESMYGVLMARANAFDEPIDSWEKLLYRLVHIDPADFTSIQVNGKNVYYHEKKQDVYTWLSDDGTVEYHFHLEDVSFTVEEMEKILAHIVQ